MTQKVLPGPAQGPPGLSPAAISLSRSSPTTRAPRILRHACSRPGFHISCTSRLDHFCHPGLDPNVIFQGRCSLAKQQSPLCIHTHRCKQTPTPSPSLPIPISPFSLSASLYSSCSAFHAYLLRCCTLLIFLYITGSSFSVPLLTLLLPNF